MCTCRYELDVFAAPKTLTVTTFSTLMTTECGTGTARRFAVSGDLTHNLRRDEVLRGPSQ